MPEEKFLVAQLHELLTYLGQLGVATVLVSVQHGLVGSGGQSHRRELPCRHGRAAALLRVDGEVRQAISVTKKRGGLHERTIREFFLEPGGIRVGEPLRRFRGVLTGIPERLRESDGRPESPDP